MPKIFIIEATKYLLTWLSTAHHNNLYL